MPSSPPPSSPAPSRRGDDTDAPPGGTRAVTPPHGGPRDGDETVLADRYRLERRIGERKVDVVLEETGDARPIVEIAHRTGIRL